MLRSLRVRLRALLHRHRADAELDEELRYHLDREVERRITGGMSATDARDSARRAFGNVTVAAEQARAAVRGRWIDELQQDAAFALRSFRRTPVFVGTVVATIGLALGLNTSVFTIFSAYVLRPLVVRDPQSLVELTWRDRMGNVHNVTWSQYQALRSRDDVFRDLGAQRFVFARIGTLPAYGKLVSSNYFVALGVGPALGRTLLPSDGDTPGSPAAIVLNYNTWQRRFGGDSSIVGKTLVARGYPLTVVGVARQGFGGLEDTPMDFWAPITMIEQLEHLRLSDATDPEIVTLVGHLRPEISIERARIVLANWSRTATGDRPPRKQLVDAQLVSRATPIQLSPELLIEVAPIAAAFVLVMIIACANVANLMLARAIARQREVGIRLALGASRARLMRQLLTEAVLLAVPSAAFGFLASRLTLDLGVHLIFATFPAYFAPYIRIVSLAPDVRVLVFMIVAAVAAAVLFGLAPAIRATRPNVVRATRGEFDGSHHPSRLRHWLLVSQVTGCVLLLICTGVLLTGSRRLREMDVGLRTRDVLTVELEHVAAARELDALRRSASQGAIASVSQIPLNGRMPTIPIQSSEHRLVRSAVDLVSASYFGVVGLPIVRGRGFTDAEAHERAAIAVISESSARQFWPNRDPLGRWLRITLDSADRSAAVARYVDARVVGVARDVVMGFVGFGVEPSLVYYPAPVDSGSSYVMRVNGAPERARRHLAEALGAVSPNAWQDIHTLSEALAFQVYPFRIAYWIGSVLGGIALVLTLTGVFGVLSYLVNQRRREIGIRIALGATSTGVISIVLRQSLRYAVTGVALGAGLALAASKLISSAFVTVIDAYDPPSFIGAIVVVIIGCIAAAYVPSRRAVSVNPVETLRADS